MFSMRRVACVECIDAILIGLSWGQEGSLLCLTFPANSSNCSLDWIWSSQAHSITQQSLRFFGPSNNVASRQGISFSRISIQIKSSTSPLIHGFGNKNLEIYKAEFAGSGRISRVNKLSLAGTQFSDISDMIMTWLIMNIMNAIYYIMAFYDILWLHDSAVTHLILMA